MIGHQLCKIKIRDVENGVKRDTHPARGTGNQMWRDAKTKLAELTRKRSHTGQEGPHNTKTRPSPTHRANYNIHITMDNNQLPSTSTNPTGRMSANLMDLPPEIMQTIMLYLPFQDTMKLRRVNRRLWRLTKMTSLCKEITISNFPLSCGLIANAINKQVTTLNIRSCSIQGSYIKMLKLGHRLQDGLSRLKFLGLQGYKGSNILAAIIIAESEELETLDLSENRYSLVGTVNEEGQQIDSHQPIRHRRTLRWNGRTSIPPLRHT